MFRLDRFYYINNTGLYDGGKLGLKVSRNITSKPQNFNIQAYQIV